MRPTGISAFVRCRNEEEYIVASLLSAYRVFDEIVVILNHSTDRSRALVEDLITDHPKIRLVDYPHECAAIGPGYHERVLAQPDASLARYYNWCLEQTRFSHVCKWDGDMIALPALVQVRPLVADSDVILFDGHDILGEETTSMEARIFRFDPSRARYVDWDLYEVLQHEYSQVAPVMDKCYVHMKLVKTEWLHKTWSSPNLLATRSAPETGVAKLSPLAVAEGWLRKVARRLLGRNINGT
ncbi:MAG: glycosyltransferase family 2 protein [Ramlibacter sp.]|nr:glycosyltransferase [Ramlibacter sp.]